MEEHLWLVRERLFPVRHLVPTVSCRGKKRSSLVLNYPNPNPTNRVVKQTNKQKNQKGKTVTIMTHFLPGHVYLQRQMTGVTSVSTGTYRKTTIVPTSCTKHTARGQSRGDGGQREHILYTKFKYTCFTSYRKENTEAWWCQRREGKR